jgi:beta-N-acetylhexosaminidase
MALAFVLAAIGIVGSVSFRGEGKGAPKSRDASATSARTNARHAASPHTSQHAEARKITLAAGGAAGTTVKLTPDQQVGQLIIATYDGTVPPESLLSAVRAGEVGAVILMGDNTADGVSTTKAATTALQHAAHEGHNPGLLIMTDQEGGEVKRLPGPPDYPAAGMSSPALAAKQGYATALALRQAGVNVDLAPVADVTRIDGFMTQEQRTFGVAPSTVAAAACSFARGLVRGGVAFTLKHFPGLGDAVQSTDNVPVDVTEPASELRSDDAAYRKCGRGRLAMVMVSSASYQHVTGSVPAVLSPITYHQLLPAAHVDAVTLSDTLESGAIRPWSSPARRAISAGLDMVLYPDYEADALNAYHGLVADIEAGSLSRARVAAAAAKVLVLKQALRLISQS